MVQKLDSVPESKSAPKSESVAAFRADERDEQGQLVHLHHLVAGVDGDDVPVTAQSELVRLLRRHREGGVERWLHDHAERFVVAHLHQRHAVPVGDDDTVQPGNTGGRKGDRRAREARMFKNHHWEWNRNWQVLTVSGCCGKTASHRPSCWRLRLSELRSPFECGEVAFASVLVCVFFALFRKVLPSSSNRQTDYVLIRKYTHL